MYGESLLSKIIDENNPKLLIKYNVTPEHFETEGEKEAYKFILNYARENEWNSPDYRTVVAEVEEFNYIPNVEDTFGFLITKVKDSAGRRLLYELMNSKEAGEKFKKSSTEVFTDWLRQKTEEIKQRVGLTNQIGIDLKKDIDPFLEEYERRKEGKSFKIWESKFPTMNKSIGGYFSGNMYTWYGRSGRGKSVFVMEEALHSAVQGANVLIWALEMSFYEWACRAYSSLSAREGKNKITISGIDYDAGFENLAMLQGRIKEEESLQEFLKELPDKLDGNITVRAVDDENFHERNLGRLESDIEITGADVVVIDPAYYLDMEVNTSKTAGGDLAATSKKLRHIAGRTQTVIHVITQADEDKKEKNEEGLRDLKAPSRAELKKSKQLLEDAVNVFGIDTLDGLGVIEIGKGRAGGEGEVIEVVYLPSFGIVREIEAGKEIAEQFEGVF